MIEIKHLTYTYPQGERAALQDIQLQIDGRQLFGLLGPNGAGKTTLLSILSGLLVAPPGSVIIDGLDISRSPSEVRRLLSLVPQEYAFYPTLTVKENLEVFAGIQAIRGSARKQRIEVVCELGGLGERLGQRADALSGGLKRRLNIAIGLLNQPRLLFLDEPTVGIDPQSRRYILESIKAIHQQGTAVIYTSHYMEEVEYLCDRIAIIDQGRLLLEGSLQELLRQNGNSLVVDLESELTPEQVERFGRHQFHCEPLRLVRPNLASGDMHRYLAILQQEQLPLVALHYGSRNLEDLFLGLTKRSLRD